MGSGTAEGKGDAGRGERRHGAAEKDRLHLHNSGGRQRGDVLLVGQGGDRGVVPVEPDPGQQREPHDHPDHASQDHQRADDTVCIGRRGRQCCGVHGREREPEAQARGNQDGSRRPRLQGSVSPPGHRDERDTGEGETGRGH